MKIGLIGAQNSHSRGFCEAINKNRLWDGAAICYLYGADDPAEAKNLCEQYGIAECSSEEETIERSDAVVITYRKGSMHYSPAMKAIGVGKPLFNDKPFATSLREAREIADLAKERGVLLAGGSSLKCLPELKKIREAITPGSTVTVSFSADPASEYDGYWFYGIHSVEVCLELCGLDFVSARSYKNKDVVITNVAYPDRLCVIVTAPQSNGLAVSVSGAGETACHMVPLNIQSAGPEELLDMVKKGQPPRSYEFYAKAVELTGKIIETAGLA